MQSLSASANCTNGSRASRTFSGITSFTFCPKLGLEHLGNRVPILFTRPRVALNQLGPCCHQRLPRSQHHQVLPHLSTAVPYRVQRGVEGKLCLRKDRSSRRCGKCGPKVQGAVGKPSFGFSTAPALSTTLSPTNFHLRCWPS